MINYRKNLLATLLVTIICLSIFVSANPVSAKKNTNVYPTDSLQTIQNAITTAAPGATIIFNAGTYTQGQIIVDNSVTLKGKNAIIEYSLQQAFVGVQAAITVLANDVTITGFTIHAITTGTARDMDAAIDVRSSLRCSIEKNVIDSPARGVTGIGAISITISKNDISAQFPVHLTSATDVTIINNGLTAKQYTNSPAIPQNNNPIFAVSAIKFNDFTLGGSIKGNQIDSEKVGIVANQMPGTAFASNIEIKSNQILAGLDGIQIYNGQNIILKNNVINTQGNGIRIENAMLTKATVTSNTVNSVKTAIMVRNSLNGVISNNQIYVTGAVNGGISIGLFGSGGAATYNLVSQNTISGNFLWGIAFASSYNTATRNTITGGSTSPDYAYWFAGYPGLNNPRDNLVTENIVSGVDYLVTSGYVYNDPLLNNVVTDVIQP